MNGSLSVAVVPETWFDKTTNKNSFLERKSYSALHKTSKNQKEDGICIYIHKSLEFNVRDDINVSNESVQTLSIEILNKKLRNIALAAAFHPPKQISDYLRIFTITFYLNKKCPPKQLRKF